MRIKDLTKKFFEGREDTPPEDRGCNDREEMEREKQELLERQHEVAKKLHVLEWRAATGGMHRPDHER